jgi:sporulation protein YlmC with PRC-barrel domain
MTDENENQAENSDATTPRERGIMAADTLTGEKVVNPDGESLGHVRHIMLDMDEGVIAYVVLSFHGFLGMGEKLFAIPWRSLALDRKNKWLVLDIDKERLRNAPGFDKENWPSMADPAWAANIHAYYGPVAVSRRPFI